MEEYEILKVWEEDIPVYMIVSLWHMARKHILNQNVLCIVFPDLCCPV